MKHELLIKLGRGYETWEDAQNDFASTNSTEMKPYLEAEGWTEEELTTLWPLLNIPDPE